MKEKGLGFGVWPFDTNFRRLNSTQDDRFGVNEDEIILK
jgi:hypothetical protein